MDPLIPELDRLIPELDPLIPEMDPFRRAQIILFCDLCKTAHLQSHCDRCDINLCEVCVGKHLSNTSIRHKVVPYKYRKSLNYSKCPDHAEEQCKHYCETCDIPVCSICVSSGKHKYHNLSDILEKLDSKTESLKTDLEELESRIYPRYEEMASDIQTEKLHLETNYGKLTTATDQQGEILHQEITAIVNKRKYDIRDMKNKHLSTLNKNTEEITRKITEIKHTIDDLKSMLKSKDVSLTSTYKSRNSEFRTLPPKVRVTLPSFSPQKINKDQLNAMFGCLSSLSINREHGKTMKFPDASPSAKPMLDEPRFTATIDTGYDYLFNVSCPSEDQVWTCGDNNIMKLLNLQGQLLSTIQTESGSIPDDIAMTRGGDLAYTDTRNKTVNLVKNKEIHTVITLQGWEPRNVCFTASGDLLVTCTMISYYGKQSKVVRYSGSREKQTIQFDDQRRPLYSSDGYLEKYISENRNLDICVADSGSRAVVVVKQSGKLRFRYTGHSAYSGESFEPVGIATDSQSHILTADRVNDCIHILDQDGQFLRYIHNLDAPYGLCVDSRDNLFVAESDNVKVKKIQYL